VTDDTSGLVPGAQLGKYRLDGLLGRGGMGEVWAAHDPDLDRRVALKVLRTAAASEDARLRLLREGRAMARLRHPNVITVYDATAAGDRDLIAMELIDGKSLAGWLLERHPPAAIIAAVVAAGRGLAAAHAAGMVHRDFKPHNVLVDRDGRVVVTDFGLARTAAEVVATGPAAAASVPPSRARRDDSELEIAATIAPDALGDTVATPAGASPPRTTSTARTDPDPAALESPITRTGAVLGTPAYMAPEQIEGRPADARADQFAFCVTAWEALAGSRPFQGGSLRELADAIATGAPTGADKIPARLRAILARGLAGDPLRRWPSMDALLRALERAWHRPRRTAIAAVIAVAIVGLAAIPIGMWLRGDTRTGACPSAEADLAPLQTPEARAHMRALAQFGVGGQRATAYFDRWKTAWRAARTEVCRAPKDPEFHARRSCLESTRDRLLQLLELTEHAAPESLASTDLVMVLPMPDGCVDRPLAVAPPLPPDPVVRAEVMRITGALLAARLAAARRPADARAELDGLVEAATRTGYDPILAEVLQVRGDASLDAAPVAACADLDQAIVLADRAGADAERVRAMLGRIECTERQPGLRRELEPLIERARGLIERMGDAAAGAHLDLMVAAIRGVDGDWDQAIQRAEAARAALQALDAPVTASKAAVLEARYLAARATGDDLQRSEQVLRDALDAVPPGAERAVIHLRQALGDVLWTRGRLDEAVAVLLQFAAPVPAGDLELTVHVVDSTGAPADGAEVVAAIDPIGDPIRLVRTELVPAVSARTDADGTATISVQAGAVILARKHDELGAIEAPTGLRVVRISLVPAAHVQVQVTAATGPPPAEPREARHAPAIGAVSMQVGARRWSLVSPLDAKGVFRLPALPGRVAISAELATARDDSRGAVRIVQLKAGGQTVALELARPVSLRVILRPSIDGLVIAVPGTHAPKTWRALADVLAAVEPRTVVFTAGPATVADDDVRVGDEEVQLGAPGPGPITVCGLPGAASPSWSPISVILPGPDATPPVCATTTAVDGEVTTVVLPTAR